MWIYQKRTGRKQEKANKHTVMTSLHGHTFTVCCTSGPVYINDKTPITRFIHEDINIPHQTMNRLGHFNLKLKPFHIHLK